MPLALWLLLGSVAAYLVFKSGQTAATTASAATSNALGPVTPTGTINLSVSGPTGIGPFSVPVESTLPQALQSQFKTFFVNAGQASFTDQTVLAFSNQLASQGFSIAAGSVQSVWQMVIAGLNAQQSTSQGGTASSSVCPPGTHTPTLTEQLISKSKGCVPDTSSSASPFAPIEVRTSQGVVLSKIPSPPVSK